MPKAPKGWKPKQSTVDLFSGMTLEEGHSLFGEKVDGKSWAQEKDFARLVHQSVKSPEAGAAVTEDVAIGGARRLREMRARTLHPKASIGEADISGKGGVINKSELNPIATAEPAVKSDESLRKATLGQVRERRALGERRIATRGDTDIRRQGFVKALKERSGKLTKGAKLGAVGGIAGLIVNGFSTASKLIDLNRATKGKKKPTLGQGMRMLLDLPQEENDVVRSNRQAGTLKEL